MLGGGSAPVLDWRRAGLAVEGVEPLLQDGRLLRIRAVVKDISSLTRIGFEIEQLAWPLGANAAHAGVLEIQLVAPARIGAALWIGRRAHAEVVENRREEVIGGDFSTFPAGMRPGWFPISGTRSEPSYMLNGTVLFPLPQMP